MGGLQANCFILPFTMPHFDICCIGHLTLDKVITPRSTAYLSGGTAYYFSKALQHFQLRYLLVTALAEEEMDMVASLRHAGIQVQVQPSTHTVQFENSYGHNTDHRTQRVPRQADSFSLDNLQQVSADIFHLGPLLANDMSLELIKALAAKGKVSLDVQGYMRKVVNEEVIPVDWPEKQLALPYIHTLKANEHELEVLTGQTDLQEGARLLAGWGIKEVVITLGSAGSVIYADDTFYHIPAYTPHAAIDATGCGDTYMAGYLYQRFKGADIDTAGRFASAMAGLKIGVSGAFDGDEEQVLALLNG